MGIDAIATKPDEAATSLPNKTALDPVASSSSLRPIIPIGRGEALKNAVLLDDSTDPLHTERVDDVDAMTDPVIAHLDPLLDPPVVEPIFHTLKGEVSSETDSEGNESDFSHPAEGVSWADQLEDSGWKEVTAKKGKKNKTQVASVVSPKTRAAKNKLLHK